MDTGSVLISDTTENYDVFLCPTLCQERREVKDTVSETTRSYLYLSR